MKKVLLPGEKIGMLGSGQLGRMFALSAVQMGYQVVSYSPEKNPPIAQVASHIQGEYEDLSRLSEFASQVKVVTLEFENIPAAATKKIEETTPVYPGTSVLQTTQHRIREKKFLSDNGFPVVKYRHIKLREELPRAVVELGTPCILKTAGFGYDGKGQVKLDSDSNLSALFGNGEFPESILEAFVPFEKEVSVVCARAINGSFAHWPLFENAHKNHILDLTLCPARVSNSISTQAVDLAKKIVDTLGVVGTFCIEFFVTRDEKLIVNEMAPRPHNSGHLTIDASATSQFEQQLRAITGMALGSTKMIRPAAMVNLLGDLWKNGEPHWKKVLELADVHLHLYGKAEARPGRKMGHLTALSDSVDAALDIALRARAMLA